MAFEDTHYSEFIITSSGPSSAVHFTTGYSEASRVESKQYYVIDSHTGIHMDQYWSGTGLLKLRPCTSLWQFLFTCSLTSPDHGAEEGSAESPCLETYHFFRALLRRLNLTSECCLVNGTHCGEGEGGEGGGRTGLTDPAQGL